MASRKTPKSPGKTPSKPQPNVPSTTKAAAKSSAKSTVSGPARKGGAAGIPDAATAKLAGAETLAQSMPFNAAKALEHGHAAMKPPTGQSVEPPHPMVTGSTLTETNASEKVGSGNPQASFNPTVGPLDRVRV